ncbi:MAG: replication restart helicase PriA, partial [Cyclobacteriaceae bacterium]
GVLNGTYPLVVGVRSAVMLPFDHLGLIIVDEEHENSYKQYEPAPRYHARDVALVLAQKHRAKTLLGSATPSVETYHLAKEKRHGLVVLSQRYGEAQLPKFQLVKLEKTKEPQNDFSPELVAAMENCLTKNEQVIIFQNRRGYAPFLSCQVCGWIPECNHCSVSLTYHMYTQELRCHYCGYKEKMPTTCRECESSDLDLKGYGTEQLEENLKLLFPEAKVQRMDLDTTRRKHSYQAIIDDFEKGDIDILVGTQMVTKGLDFDKVSLVGVLDIDRIIHYPDFRSHEKAFQLITQVSGRAGRRDQPGLVIIQTNQPQHPLLHKIVTYDYAGCFEREIYERENYQWPPFVRLIRMVVKSTDKQQVGPAAFQLHGSLANALGAARVLGPQEPMISKIRNYYLMEIYIKLERDKINMGAAKQLLKEQTATLKQDKKYKKVQVVIDVDPY